METYLTVEELAAYLKINKQTIRRWVSMGEVPFRKVKNSVRFRLSEIEKWVENNGSSETTNKQESNEPDLFSEEEMRG